MLNLNLGKLKQQSGAQMPVQIQAVCDPLAYGYPDWRFWGPIVFQGSADNKGDQIQVSGSFEASLVLGCSRCGQEVSSPVKLPFDELYTWLSANPDQDGEQDLHCFSGDSIDLMPEILRLIFWELPMKPLCQANCQGLCPNCGIDLNLTNCTCAQDQIDPRWEKLQKLLQEQSAKGGQNHGRT